MAPGGLRPGGAVVTYPRHRFTDWRIVEAIAVNDGAAITNRRLWDRVQRAVTAGLIEARVGEDEGQLFYVTESGRIFLQGVEAARSEC